MNEERTGFGLLQTEHILLLVNGRKFISDLRQVGEFQRILWFPPTTKIAAIV